MTTSDETLTNRRGASRRRVLKRALIVFQSGNCTMNSQILDISETGAKLIPADALMCPAEFMLKPELGKSRSCEVVWRKGKTIGVQFID